MADSPDTDIIQQNDGREIAPVEERFPTAMVKGAQTDLEVFQGWKEKWGLVPREVTAEEVLQEIRFIHDPLTGQFKWETKNISGLMAMLLVLTGLLHMPEPEGDGSMLAYFTKGLGRGSLDTGEAGVIIGFKDNRLALDWFPKDVPSPKLAMKKLVATTLAYLVAEESGEPLDNFLEAFGWSRAV